MAKVAMLVVKKFRNEKQVSPRLERIIARRRPKWSDMGPDINAPINAAPGAIDMIVVPSLDRSQTIPNSLRKLLPLNKNSVHGVTEP